MVKSNPGAVRELRTENRNLGIPLTEMVQHDQLGVHLQPAVNRFCGRAVVSKGEMMYKINSLLHSVSTTP